MTAASVSVPAAVGRLRHVFSAVWGTISGIAPHVLHHIGPLAGAAILAGTGGRVLFFLLGLAFAIPMLVRLYRRFRTWVAPSIAVAVFGVTYTLSSVFIGPLISGNSAESAANVLEVTTSTDQHGH